VHHLWSEKGLSREVNRATSLRNFIKMLLCIENKPLRGDKSGFVETLPEVFQHFLHHGFLLLNATLVYRKEKVREDARQWQVFIRVLLNEIYPLYPETELILFGNFAQKLETLIEFPYKKIIAEHPYNLSFIENPHVLKYFKQFRLLSRE
jgi:uracil-DNA glycosylase